jgi:alpha-glucosidase
MNLKGKGWKILPLINMLSERSRTFIQSSSLFYWVTNKQAYGIFFDNTFRTFFDFVTRRRNVTVFGQKEGNELLFYPWSSNGGRCH